MEPSLQAMAVGESIPVTLCFGDVGLALPASCPIPMVTTLITLGTRLAALLASRLSRELRPLLSCKPSGTPKAMPSLCVTTLELPLVSIRVNENDDLVGVKSWIFLGGQGGIIFDFFRSSFFWIPYSSTIIFSGGGRNSGFFDHVFLIFWVGGET